MVLVPRDRDGGSFANRVLSMRCNEVLTGHKNYFKVDLFSVMANIFYIEFKIGYGDF